MTSASSFVNIVVSQYQFSPLFGYWLIGVIEVVQNTITLNIFASNQLFSTFINTCSSLSFNMNIEQGIMVIVHGVQGSEVENPKNLVRLLVDRRGA